MISDEKVGPKGVRVRCKKCGNVISVRRPVENGARSEERPAPVAAAAGGGAGAAVQGSLDAELGQAFDHAFGGEAATTPAAAAPGSAAAEAAKADAAVSEPGALELPAGDELPAFAVAAHPARTPAPAAPPPATEWYVAIGQAQVGPLPLEEVRRKWEGADVGPDSLVWRPGMGDWAPLSSVADLAAYLAPFPVSPRQSRTPAPSAHQAGPAASPATTPAPGGDVVWKPVGASALAALASEEIATRTPEPRAESRNGAAVGAVRTLVEKMDLPDGGGVDPTGAIPLPMKALETTGEHRMERISSVARGAEEIRQRRSAARGIAIAVVALLVVGGGAAAWLLMGRKSTEPARPAPVATSAPVPAAPVPEPAPAKPPEPAMAAAPAASEPAKTEAAPPEAPRPEAATAETAQAEPRPEPAVAAPEHPAPAAEAAAPAHEAAKPEPARMTRAQRREALRKERLAQAAAAKAAAKAPASAAPAPAPAPEQPRKRRDVLDFESNDSALEAALGTSKPAAGSRSVYVPPAPSGTALPDRVTDSQVNETILGRVSALEQCVQEQKARDADGTGVLKMHWSIAPDGTARDPKCMTPEFASSPIAKCVSSVLRSTRFPKSKSGRQDVTFPIKF